MHRFWILPTLALLAACPPRDVRPPRAAEETVDSVLPRAEALRRFREGLPEVTELAGGAPSRDALVRGVIHALETRDTAALGALAVTKGEYAWLYYPTTPQRLPPYDLAPGLYWFMLEGRSRHGLAYLLAERSGAPLRLIGYDCGTTATREGGNTLHGPCLVRRLQAPGDTVTERYFSLIVERAGRFKVLAYSGEQD
jgi:hypothetical protein